MKKTNNKLFEDLLIPLYAAFVSWDEPIDDKKFIDNLKKAVDTGNKKKIKELVYGIGQKMSLNWGIEVFGLLGLSEEVKKLERANP